MSNYRRTNWSPLQPDPVYPKPKNPPVFDSSKSTQLDGAVYLLWSYPWADAETITGYRIRAYLESDRATVIRETYVSEPDTDLIIDGLVNGTYYFFTATAVNPGGEGPANAGIALIPSAPVIAVPVLKTLDPDGDGFAKATWTWSEPVKAGFEYVWASYEAVNEGGAVVTEHVTGGEYPATSGRLPLQNEHDYKVALVAVARDKTTGKYYTSSLSNSMNVRVEKPIPPYKPRLTGAQISSSNNGQIDVAFAPGIQNVSSRRRRWWHNLTASGRTGPEDITAWQVRVTSDADSKVSYTYDIPNGAARSYTTPKVNLGTWLVDVRATNSVGWSDYSNQLAVTYKPTDTRPFTADSPFSTFETPSYYYAIFDPGNDPGKGWDKTWKCTFTAAGKALSYDVLLVGGGGGGKGQTATLGKGGNGGGGQLNTVSGLTSTSDTFTVFVSIGGSTAIDPKNTSVTFSGVETLALAGKSSSSGQDATGYPRTAVDASWLDCTIAFAWLTPDSQSVGGVAQDGKQGFPNGLGWGCAGAGTKNSTPGKGVEGLVIVRWPK